MAGAVCPELIAKVKINAVAAKRGMLNLIYDTGLISIRLPSGNRAQNGGKLAPPPDALGGESISTAKLHALPESFTRALSGTIPKKLEILLARLAETCHKKIGFGTIKR